MIIYDHLWIYVEMDGFRIWLFTFTNLLAFFNNSCVALCSATTFWNSVFSWDPWRDPWSTNGVTPALQKGTITDWNNTNLDYLRLLLYWFMLTFYFYVILIIIWFNQQKQQVKVSEAKPKAKCGLCRRWHFDRRFFLPSAAHPSDETSVAAQNLAHQAHGMMAEAGATCKTKHSHHI